MPAIPLPGFVELGVVYANVKKRQKDSRIEPEGFQGSGFELLGGLAVSLCLIRP